MPIDKDKFASHLRTHAAKLSQRKCATYVRRALEAGGAQTIGHPVHAKDYGALLEKNGDRLLSIVLSRLVLVIVCLFPVIALAVDEAPKTLRVPVVGLRYNVAVAGFERVPEALLAPCPALMPDDNMRGVFWIYASAQQDTRHYYVIGGYGIRARPEPPDFPHYEPLDLGTVVEIDGNECMIFGEALEVFEARFRVTQALGGKVQLKSMVRDQRINLTNISPEISKAFLVGIEARSF